MRHWLFAGMLVAAGLGLAACGGRFSPPSGTTPPSQVIEVVAKEWAFEPATIAVRAGRLIFRVKNDGVVEHNFALEQRPGAEVSAIKPGEAKSLAVTLGPGTYTVFCNLPGHREAGMVASVRVRE
jgi:uncharacterized cupredoxin-like copper-binding protein